MFIVSRAFHPTPRRACWGACDRGKGPRRASGQKEGPRRGGPFLATWQISRWARGHGLERANEPKDVRAVGGWALRSRGGRGSDPRELLTVSHLCQPTPARVHVLL